MGIFGPSKKEIELEGKLEEAVKSLKDVEYWKENTLNPQMAELKETIRVQKSTLIDIGALEHTQREKLIKETKIKLEEIETEYSQRKSSLDQKLKNDLDKAEQERESQSAFIESDLKYRKSTADKAYSDYEKEYSDSYNKLITDFNAKKLELEEMQDSTIRLKEVATLQDIGFFEYENPAQSSVQLASKLEQVRFKIKEMLKIGSAASVVEDFTFNNSKAQGKRFANDMKKLMLRAYNAEAENAIKSIKTGNLQTATKRLDKTREGAQKLGEFIRLTINPQFHSLRLEEVELAHEHLQTLKLESEIEKERRSQLREEAKVEAELKKAKAAKEAERKKIQEELKAEQRAIEARRKLRLEKEKGHYQNVADSPEVQADEAALASIKAKLVDTEKAIKDLDYREANARAGYVYVLSNIGAFGESVVKIGMTRRLDPRERVKELSGASVPFIFDTHLMVFSDNARELEHKLHKKFSATRVNKANPRKEYFHTTPESVLAVLKEMNVTVVEFTKEAEASEYRSGL